MNPSRTLPPITAADVQPANEVRVQLETRISTQNLPYRSGDEESALNSVYDLFATGRRLMISFPEARAFEAAATFMLNNVVRPYTARWHRWLVDDRFPGELTRRQFRYELKQLQPRLRCLLQLFRTLDHPRNQDEANALFERIQTETPEPYGQANLGPNLPAGIGPEVSSRMNGFKRQFHPFVAVDEVNQAEWKFIRQRREALQGLNPNDSAVENAVENATGLCLSGGGIRSATFCLGIVQVLARQKLLAHFDYLSTVSGGGYLGAFLTSYLGTPKGGPHLKGHEQPFSGNTIQSTIDKTFRPEGSRESAAVRHLRNNSRYLLSGGIWGRVKIVALLVTGIVTNLLLMLPLSLAAALAAFGLKQAGFFQQPKWSWWPLPASPAMALLLLLTGLLVIASFALPIVRNFARGAPPGSRPAKVRSLWETISLGLALLTLAAGVLASLPNLMSVYTGVRNWTITPGSFPKWLQSETMWGAIAAGAPFILGLLAARIKAGAVKKWMAGLFAVSGPVFYLGVFLAVGSRLYTGEWPVLPVLLPTALVLVWSWLAVDINAFSPHVYYRARLCECYLAAAEIDQAGAIKKAKKWFLHGKGSPEVSSHVGNLLQLPISCMNQTGAAPYHLINTAANLPLSHEPNLRGRDCDFFVFSRYFCGGPVCGYIPTKELEKLDPHVEIQQKTVASKHLAAEAVRVFADDRELSTLVALEAVAAFPTIEAERALRQTLLEFPARLALNGEPNRALAAVFSPDGKRILTSSEAGIIQCWDTPAGTNSWTLRLGAHGIGTWNFRAFSANGEKFLAFAQPESIAIGHWEDGDTRLYNIVTGQMLCEVQQESTCDAALSPDGTIIATAGFDTVVRLWDARGQLLRTLRGHEGRVKSVNFSPGGKQLVSAAWDGKARVWDVASGRTLEVLAGSKLFESAVFDPAGSRVLTVGNDKTGSEILLWDWANKPGSPLAIFTGHKGEINSSKFSADGSKLLTAGSDDTARIWESSTGECLHVLSGHADEVTGVDFSPDGKWAVTVSLDRTARIWETATGEELMQCGGNDSPRTSVAFSPDGKRIVTGSSSGTASVYTCEVCGTLDELAALARARVKRALTADEKRRYAIGR